MKCLAVLALATTAAAFTAQETIPVAAMKLTGDALRDYINSANVGWKAAKPKDNRRNTLMAIKHTKLPNGVTFKPSVLPEVAATIPTSFDARQQWPKCASSIGGIRDQSQCGSCWAFGAAEAMSDRLCIATDGATKVNLAAEDILSCCGSYCGYGCDGGYPIRAWNWFVSNGVCTGGGFYEQDGCKPYSIEPCGTHIVNNQSHYHNCQNYEPDTPRCASKCTNAAYTTGYKNDKYFGKSAYAVRARVSDIQTEIMTNGPVEVAFTVYEDFENYAGGIYKYTGGSVLGGHAVKFVGWGEENNVPYWIVANSWNTNWGEDGFFRIRRGTNECGIEEAVVAGLVKV